MSAVPPRWPCNNTFALCLTSLTSRRAKASKSTRPPSGLALNEDCNSPTDCWPKSTAARATDPGRTLPYRNQGRERVSLAHEGNDIGSETSCRSKPGELPRDGGLDG